ncbi:tetratricopeptide repeat protein 29-like [Actinia tenebrosa]|uniref:Tetratricopeptide repeat protein 29 n=1 Tax=Actinia tenebrosa TaxID=6105 RepID=A0A6P8HD39_ACTTE|nr:tetratricopeptide repeat protein 29-like [Actinia tenebrosa]
MTSITTLPAIKVGGQVTQQVIKQVPSPPSKGGSIGSPRTRSRSYFSRGGQSSDTKAGSYEKIETARYRNTYEHNLCLDMLKDGYHQSFSELFNLMEQQKQEREKLGPDSGLSDLPLLEDEPDKLDQLKLHLTTAEASKRRGKMDIVYHSLLSLAKYFEESGDLWLSNHFYKSCLTTSLKIRGDGRKKESEANCNMGLALEKNGDLLKSVEYFEAFYNLTKGRLWQNDDGENLHSLSCENLKRVHTAIADGLKEEDMMASISYLLKAYEMAKESGNAQQEGLAGYRLGKAYEEVADPETAILYHNGYLEKCQQLSDGVGMGRACQALARAYEMQGDIESAMKYLEMFVELADRAQQLPEQQSACCSLGEMYNSMGKYLEGVRMFKRAYEIAQDLGNPVVIENARIQLGITNGHLMLSGFSTTMNNVCKSNIQKILDFKSSRSDSFSDGEQRHDNQSRAEVHIDSESQDSAQESGVQETNEAETEESTQKQLSEEENSGIDAKENVGSDSGITSEQEGEKTESS